MGIVTEIAVQGMKCEYCKTVMVTMPGASESETVLMALRCGWTVSGDYREPTLISVCAKPACMMSFVTEKIYGRVYLYTEFPGPKQEAK